MLKLWSCPFILGGDNSKLQVELVIIKAENNLPFTTWFAYVESATGIILTLRSSHLQ